MIKKSWQEYVFCKFPVIFFISLFLPVSLMAQETADPAESIFEEIASQNRFIESLAGLVDVSGQAFNLPLGIKKNIGNIPLTLAVNKEYQFLKWSHT